MSRTKKEEKPTLLGARVYKKHRKMLSALSKKRKVKLAEALRLAIEESHEQHIPA